MKKYYTLTALIAFISLSTGFSQGTFSNINANIFQASCTAGCHNSTTLAGNLDLSGTDAQVYANIVGVTSTNTQAQTLNLKRISAGYPERSFLLRKVKNTLDSTLQLSFLGADATHNFLTKPQAELIRQWILFGAPDTGIVVNEQLLTDYYTNGMGLASLPSPPTPSDEGLQGFQMRVGPIFLAPGEEKEFFKKYETGLSAAVEIYKTKANIATQSHHLILLNTDTSYASTFPQGLQLLTGLPDAFSIHFNSQQVATWQFSREETLPAGTAYKWKAGAVLFENYHIVNYSTDSILAAEAYINVYSHPAGTGAQTMFSELFMYGEPNNPFLLNIPNTGQPVTKSFKVDSADLSPYYNHPAGLTFNFWILQAHTHKLATAFNMYLRNPDGSKGQRVYDGNYNTEYTALQGYYDFSHPPVEHFPSFLPVNMDNGLLFEATWVNNTSTDVGFGLTTHDEMFIGYVQFTVTLPSGIDSKNATESVLHVYPNPASDVLNISFDEKGKSMPVMLEIDDLLGNRIYALEDKTAENMLYRKQLWLKELKLSTGLYLLKVTKGDYSYTKKLLID